MMGARRGVHRDLADRPTVHRQAVAGGASPISAQTMAGARIARVAFWERLVWEGDSMSASVAKRWSIVRRRVDAGMTTAEYAVGTLAACAFAAVLLAIVRSGPIKSALTKVITTALGIAG